MVIFSQGIKPHNFLTLTKIVRSILL